MPKAPRSVRVFAVFLLASSIPGYGHKSDGSAVHAFIWDPIHGSTDLTPGNGNSASAFDINDLGQVVGVTGAYGGSSIPFLYEDGQQYNLYDLLGRPKDWTSLTPRAINNEGQIAGYGFYDGELRAFLLTPLAPSAASVPEPASLALLMLAPVALLHRRYRLHRS
jgi:probable HAF family extracellular repeat protein